MAAAENRCPNCGAVRPADATEGYCPRCLVSEARAGITPAPTDRTTEKDSVPADSEAPADAPWSPVMSAASSRTDATGDRNLDGGDPTRRDDGHDGTNDLPRGDAVRHFGDYELQREIARGGMGVVYKARQVSLNRPVALKMILAGNLAGDNEIRRFHLEAEAAANLDHPGIVPIFEVGQHQGQHYFSMGFVEGQSLAQRIAEGPLPPREAAALMVPIAEAVQYAHDKGVIHRDLKPGNVMLDAQGRPKVTDFGLAKKLQSDSELTSTGQIMGTPSYMPPEQARGDAGIGPLADVYALGALLYCLLTGRPPFQAASALDTLKQVLEQDPPAPKSLNAVIPLDLETIALRCLQKEPHRRYRSARELAEDLNRFLAGEPILARPVGRLEKGVKWARRHEAVAALLTTLATVLTVGFAVMAVLWSRAELNAKIARTNALTAQNLATKEAKALTAAQTQERIALEQKRIALSEAEHLAREDYVNRVNRAYREVQDDNVALAEDLLHGCPTDRRGWEWYYVERLCNSERLTLDLGKTSVNALAFSPDGTWAVFSRGAVIIGASIRSHDRETTTIEVCDVSSGQRRKTLPGAKGIVFDIAVSPDGKRVAAGCSAGTVVVWDVETGQTVWTRSYRNPETEYWACAMSVAFNPDGKSLAVGYGRFSGDEVGRVKVWDVASGMEIKAFAGPRGGVSKVAFHPDGNRLAVAGSEVVEVWDLSTVRKLHDLKGHKKWVYCVAYSPDGKWLATGGWDRTVKLRDAATGAEALTIFGHEGFVLSFAFSPDSHNLVTTSEDRSTRLWDIPSGQLLAVFHGHTDFIQTVAFRPDGREVATGGMDGSIRFWDLKTSRPVVVEHSGWVERLAFRRDGLRVLSEAGFYRTDAVPTKGWNPLTGDFDSALAGTDFNALPAEFVRGARGQMDRRPGQEETVTSPDGKLVAQIVSTLHETSSELKDFASRSKEYASSAVLIREMATGRVIHTVTGHTADVVSIAFSPDGRRLATASFDRTLKLWDVQTGQDVFTLRGHNAGLVCLAYSPDGNQIVSGGIDFTARVWNATPLPSKVIAEHDARYRKKGEMLTQLNAATDDLDRAKFLAGSGQWGMAAEAFAQAVAKDPGNLQLRHQHIDALVKSGNLNRAGLACDDVLKRFAGYEARKPIVELAARFDEIRSSLIKRQPDDSQLQMFLARSLAVSGRQSLAEKQPAKAIADLEQSREILTRLIAKYPKPQWTVAKPIETVSNGGATLTRLDDDSILAGGINPERDTYTITTAVPLERVTAIRLEAIPDPSLPHGTSGRAFNGNFGLCEWKVTSQTQDSREAARLIRWKDAASDHRVEPAEHYSKHLMDIGLAIDGDMQTYWDTWPKSGAPHWAVFVPDEPIGGGGDVQLKFIMEFGQGQHNLGRFRLSVSGDDRALEAEGVQEMFRNGEIADLNVALAMAHAQLGRLSDALASFCEAVPLATDRAAKARIIAAAAPVEGVLEKLTEQTASDWQFQAELGRHFTEQGKAPLAAEALARAVAKEPANLPLRYELIEALVEAGDQSRIGPACDDMLKQVGNAADPLRALGVAAVCRLAPLAITDPEKRMAIHELARAPEGSMQALVLGKHGQWDLVASAFTKHVKEKHGDDKPEGLRCFSIQLLSLIETTDLPGYRSAAGKLLSQFSKTSDPSSLNAAAWFCTFAPDAVADLTVPVQMAEKALAGYRPEQKRLALNTLGAALYRAGRIDEAIARLDESVKASGGAGVPEDWVFLAMAHQKKGNGDEARRWLEKARSHVKDTKTAFSSELVATRILLKEAEPLLGESPSAQP